MVIDVVDIELPLEEIQAESRGVVRTRYCIKHHYDIGDQRVFVERAVGAVDGRRAAVYLQFRCEAWFGEDKVLSNLGVAALLVAFYGFKHSASSSTCEVVDMHWDRERACARGADLATDAALARPGLRDAMVPHVTG